MGRSNQRRYLTPEDVLPVYINIARQSIRNRHYPSRDLQAHLDHATFYQDYAKLGRIQELMATEQRRYDFEAPNLNAMVDVTPISFWDWLRNEWGAL